MADLKISALTSATTPVAGTEVLPIVQSGTTKKVSIDNLTAGKTVPAKQVNVTSTDTAEVHLICTGQQEYILGSTGASYGDAGKLITYLIGVGELSQYDTAGNLKLQKGNLIQGTAAKGVNFTANTPAAGMTSQLLNWYEEGTYTATLTPATSGTIPLNSNFDTLAYTRIGRQVTVTGQIQIFNPSSPVGANFRLNLPFTPADLPEISGRGGFMLNYQNTAVSAYWEEGTASLYIIKDASTVANTDNLYISFSYFTA